MLHAICADDQALVEGGDRGARLERHHVASAHLSHHPDVVWAHYQRLGDPVPVLLAVALPEDDLVPVLELIQVIEDEVTARTRPPKAMSLEVDVPLQRIGPRQGGLRHVPDAVVERPLAIRVEDRGVMDAQSVYREAHYRPGRQVVVAGFPRRLDVLAYRHGPIRLGHRQDSLLRLASRFWLGSGRRLGFRSRLDLRRFGLGFGFDLLRPRLRWRWGRSVAQRLDRGLPSLRCDCSLGFRT